MLGLRRRLGGVLVAELSNLRRQLEVKANAAATRTAREWERRLQEDSPIDTGRMVSATSVRARPARNGAIIEALVDTPYAHIVASGQRPHLITEAAPGKFLYNARKGFAAVSPVSHPGATPRTWWDDALRDVPNMLQRHWNGVR